MQYPLRRAALPLFLRKGEVLRQRRRDGVYFAHHSPTQSATFTWRLKSHPEVQQIALRSLFTHTANCLLLTVYC